MILLLAYCIFIYILAGIGLFIMIIIDGPMGDNEKRELIPWIMLAPLWAPFLLLFFVFLGPILLVEKAFFYIIDIPHYLGTKVREAVKNNND